MQTTTSSPNWLDTSSYPFEPQYFESSTGRIHYVDQGEGDPILFVHGTPTWSFLYRDFIKRFSARYRCIALDHLGFGLSDKPVDFAGRPEDHSENLIQLIEHLELENITLVVHDFGGPIGLGAALKIPHRVNKIVMMNTWLWETKTSAEVQKIDKIVNSWVGKFMYLNLNFSPNFLLKKAFHDKVKLTRKIHQQYIRPFPTKPSRMGALNLARSLSGSSDWYQTQWDQLDTLKSKPWLILWGKHDPFLSMDFLEKWKGALPQAEIHELESGHFVQEEATEQSISLMDDFLAK